MTKYNFELWRAKDFPKLGKKQKTIINSFNKYDDKHHSNTRTIALNHKEIVKSVQRISKSSLLRIGITKFE